jgi:hypothetical protein
MLMLSCAALFAACEGEEPEAQKIAITLTADVDEVMVGESVTFTVIAEDGTDVTANSKFIDKSSDYAVVSNPYVLPYDGKIEVYAMYGENKSNTITITAKLGFPMLKEDNNPTKVNFSHRMLLVDHTGSKCTFCPKMMNALKEIEETDGYHEKYYEVMCHSYSNNISADKAYSAAAGVISGFFGVNEHPTLTYNFDTSKKSTYNDNIKGNIDSYWGAMEGDAGIAAVTLVGRSCVNTEVAVKVKSAGEYRLTAWLLEDGIEQAQAGYTAEWQNIHNNVVRSIISNDPLSGVDLGTIEAGGSVKKTFAFENLHRKWNRDNLKVLFIVSKADANGKYDVVNVALCPANDAIDYEYID